MKLLWNFAAGGGVGACGNAGARIQEDRGDTFIEIAGFSCSSPLDPSVFTDFVVEGRVCDGVSGCQQTAAIPVPMTAEALFSLCPPPPPASGCPLDESCQSCVGVGGGGSTSVGGKGAGTSPADSGPGAFLRYLAGGIGSTGFPGSADHRIALGRYWSHDYAERIVEAPDASHVWLLTRFGSFREFTDTEPDGVYDVVVPSDEYRTLTKTASGWELTDLAGTVQEFRADGLWIETRDRNGNASSASYTGTTLESVAFPDGRSELFAYHPSGKLASITEVGVGVSDCFLDPDSCRTWGYAWSGNDLVRIDRPDGTALELLYEDPGFPGYMTRMTLAGDDATSERIEGAWEYDAEGNAFRSWRGAATFTDPAAVDRWELSFDDPADPTQTTVTDPLGNVAVFGVDRDPASRKPRVTSISGDCPVCGSGPNAQLFYEDPANPLRATREIDGRGNETHFEYDGNGQVTRRIEAFMSPVERETTWEYDPIFPAFITEIEQPSTTGVPLDFRRTSVSIDGSGNATTRTIEGFEDVAGAGDDQPFAYSTVTMYTAEGLVDTIDPPGYGAADVTSFTYDPARGSVIVETRTDPLVGTTIFGYDDLNRRTSVTDPNGVVTETEYDELDRVTKVIQRGASPAEDLVTESVYNTFGDLFRTILPEGNVIEYGYDAAGRLESIERKDNLATPGERTFFTLDAAGNRTDEAMQRWDTTLADWVTESSTSFVYSSRCHLDRIDHPDGSSTEFAYDCNGNLEETWDENHDSASDPPTQSFVYDELDRLEEVHQPWTGAGGGEAVTTYGYDVQDHLTSVTDAEGNTTVYVYSDRDLMTEEGSPVSGTTTFVYNEHGELTEETDARGVVVTRTVDELDRVTLVDYPDGALDTTYTYDDPTVAFSLGRLTAIARNGESVDYAYDRFGRLTQDGELIFGYDDNGNRTTIDYPGGVTATYGFDFADRESSLSVTTPLSSRSVVTGAGYLPSGPLMTLALGNGTTETRLFTSRYLPDEIRLDAPEPRRWIYLTDGVGNVTEITAIAGCLDDDLLLANQTLTTTELFETCRAIEAGPAFAVDPPGHVTFRAGTGIALQPGFSVATGATFSADADPTLAPEIDVRTYDYQDVHYFLTQADGPWGQLAWTYDTIGNRLTETRDTLTDTYLYAPNPTAGNTPILSEIQLGILGTRTYQYGPAGHLQEVAAGTNTVTFTSDDAGRLAQLERAGNTAPLAYDGRSFLTAAGDLPTAGQTDPLYSSQGLLHGLRKQASPTAPVETTLVFYLAGRPVAQLTDPGGTETWTFLTTDHLGTPQVATDLAGTELWAGPFEPFGADYLDGTAEGALDNGVFLRLPGQWDDEVWREASSGTQVHYNLHRWYTYGTGRYSRTDPLGLPDPVDFDDSFLNLYEYAASNPLGLVDPLGLLSLAPDFGNPLPRRCRRRFQNKVLPRLTKTLDNCDCKDFFRDELNSDLGELLQDDLPFIVATGRQGGAFRCATVLGTPDFRATPPRLRDAAPGRPVRLIEVGRPLLCGGSTRRTVQGILHELGHLADCFGNNDRFTGEEDGCGAEVACFGKSVGGNCRRAGFPVWN